MRPEILTTEKTEVSKFALIVGTIVLGVISVLFARTIIATIDSPPQNFPVKTDITIESGMTLTEISYLLKEKQVVRSSHYFYLVAKYSFSDLFAQAGTYYFLTPKTTHQVLEAVMHGTDQSPHIRVTFPEGFSTRDIFSFLPESFIRSATDLSVHEGFLFPDTYYISGDMNINDIVTLLQENFRKKIAPLNDRIKASGFTEHEVITLASIIEREAKDRASKHIVSGILQNRLSIDMALQVDASFDYLLDKKSNEISLEDLEYDSPHNTYQHAGLPPAPIANPGMESIMAILEPAETEFYYYLTDDEGVFHYAETFEEHKLNKERYLR